VLPIFHWLSLRFEMDKKKKTMRLFAISVAFDYLCSQFEHKDNEKDSDEGRSCLEGYDEAAEGYRADAGALCAGFLSPGLHSA